VQKMLRVMRIMIALFLSVVFLTGCARVQNDDYDSGLGIIDVKAAELPKGIPDDSLIKSNNAFGLKLLDQLGDDWTGAYSPASLAMALQLTMYGADDTARAAMRQAMGISLDQPEIDSGNGKLLSILNDTKGVSVVNAVFASDDCEVKEEFIKAAADYYRAAAGRLDFDDKDKVLKTVNDWVSENTSGRIKELLTDLNPDAQMILLNALDMDLKWQNAFQSHRTAESDFFGLKATVKADLMSMDGSFRYLKKDGGQVLMLPYENNEYFMAVYLPKEGLSPARQA